MEIPITQLLSAAAQGDIVSRDRLWPVIYHELHRLARSQTARERAGGNHAAPQATTLVHKAYVRLVGDASIQWTSRRHFFGCAARIMRQILVDDARKRRRLKRGAGRPVEMLRQDAAANNGGCVEYSPEELMALDEALADLERVDARKAEIVDLRFFAGLTVDQTAAALDVSPRLVDKEWRFARAWLHAYLNR